VEGGEEGEENAEEEVAAEDGGKKSSFNPNEFKWTVSDGKPKNLS